jgi:hypothetical protein
MLTQLLAGGAFLTSIYHVHSKQKIFKLKSRRYQFMIFYEKELNRSTWPKQTGLVPYLVLWGCDVLHCLPFAVVCL